MIWNCFKINRLILFAGRLQISNISQHYTMSRLTRKKIFNAKLDHGEKLSLSVFFVVAQSHKIVTFCHSVLWCVRVRSMYMCVCGERKLYIRRNWPILFFVSSKPSYERIICGVDIMRSTICLLLLLPHYYRLLVLSPVS